MAMPLIQALKNIAENKTKKSNQNLNIHVGKAFKKNPNVRLPTKLHS